MNVHKDYKLFLLIIFLFITSICKATDEKIKKAIDEYLNTYVENNQFNGSVLVAKNGQVIIKKGYGMANYEFEIPNYSNTKFRIGSLTKPFSAISIIMLEEKGLLNVEDNLDKYIPDYPNGDKIKILHLLTHSSGIPDHTKLPDYNLDRRVYKHGITETIEKFKKIPLEFIPGTKSKYSNSGYILLGYIIEKVTNNSFEKFISENIFKPLNMKNSGFEKMDRVVKNHASGYTIMGDEIVKASYRDISNSHASGALYSTVEDLYLWDRALYTGKLVSKKSLKKMFNPFNEQFGYGWGIVNIFNRKMVGHNGETEGFYSNITRFMNEEVCVILLSNIEDAPVGKMGVDLAAILFGEKYSLPKVKKVVKVDDAILNEYVGKYELKPNFYFTITKYGSQLYCQPTGQEKLKIYPESHTKFFLKVADAQITFERNKDGIIEKILFHQGGSNIPAKKVK